MLNERYYNHQFVDASMLRDKNLTVLDCGIYPINNYDGQIIDCPFGGSGMIVVSKVNNDYVYQLASSEAGIYYRRKAGSDGFSDWESYAKNSDLAVIGKNRVPLATIDAIAKDASVTMTLNESIANYTTILFYCIVSGIAVSHEINSEFMQTLAINHPKYRYPIWVNSEKNGGMELYINSNTSVKITNMYTENTGKYYIYGIK